jgi:pSer/pThr/pTyr-binding forkhead associated (FHA) protein
MITCTTCRNRELEGELYCSECGARLPLGQPPVLSTAAFAETSRIRETARTPSLGSDRLRAGQIGLVIDGAPQSVILEGRPEYILGREGNEQVLPDLNLNPYGAREKGVSRVHAALRRDRAQVLLIDLGSTNGTRLNGKPLAAHQPMRVESGDEIRLGKLILTINFVP